MWKRSILSRLLRPIAFLYGGVIRRRNGEYTGGKKQAMRMDVPVISVGNITVGGTGKTPLVEALARHLQDRDIKGAVLSRGYRRRSRPPLVVSDGKSVCPTVEEAGDEPFLLASRLDGVPVLVGKDRACIGKMAVEHFGCGALLLDDGFQHRKLARDLDIVVIDASRPWGNGWLLPAGPLREPLSGLRRADLIVLSRVKEATDLSRVRDEVRQRTDCPIVETNHKPCEWVEPEKQLKHPLAWLRKKKLFAFAGIGNPDAFRRSIEPLCHSVVGFFTFRDHHRYADRDLFRIVSAAQRTGAEAIVTTEKDAVRFKRIPATNMPFVYLRIEIVLEKGDEFLFQALERIFLS